jgi:5,10-methylenetetrahydromethanopterin reductase
VLVPSLRHPMTNAAAIAYLEHLAPGRVAVAVGSGFTGRMVFGHRGMKWRDVAEYVRVVRALLRGEDAQWEGRTIRMLHDETCAPARPIDVPFLIAADGPKGAAVASAIGDGVFGAAALPAGVQTPWRAVLQMGTVLDEGEDVSSPRATSAVAPAAVVGMHWMYERGGPGGVEAIPGGREWLDAIGAVPEGQRHLAIHEGHLVAPNDRDQAIVPSAVGFMSAIGLVGTAAEVRSKVEALAASGVTEIAYQPAGPDIPHELERFAAATIA